MSEAEYDKISTCETAKEMCDKLEVTYEGTTKVKEAFTFKWIWVVQDGGRLKCWIHVLEIQ